VRAAGLNRADLLQKRGRYPAPPGVPADIPGLEFAGEVEQVGDEVRMWKTGQRVFGLAAGGAQAEYAVVPENHLAEIPDALDFAGAAAVPEVFITAHDAMFTQARLEPGERVLVHGTARTAEKIERAREFGLDEGVVVGDDPRVFAEAVREWTNGAGVQVLLDLVGASYLDANLDALGYRGRMILVGTLGGASAALDFRRMMGKRLQLTGTALRARSAEEKAAAVRRFAAHVVPLLARRSVRPVLDQTFALEDVRAAYERLESNETFGKVVIQMQ
jgi:NADPH:quinone reductase-like Zn-dependent oxidoreductase